jgi:hypothetical protein
MGVILSDPPAVVNQENHFHSGSAANHAAQPRPPFEVADVFRQYGAAYRRNHPLTRMQLRVMGAIEFCRTPSLGGHLEECDHCGLVRPMYNSCRDRHCPKCQRLATAEWLGDRKAELLPTGYFHNVFTVPHELNPLAAANPRRFYTQFFRSVSATLLAFAADPLHGLGGRPGITAVLHTWDQQLQYHVHLHCIIAGGALAFDGSRWLPARAHKLFSVPELARAYRAHFLESLRHACAAGELVLPGRLAEAGQFAAMVELLAAKDWVCFSQPPFSTPEKVLEYLSRYTHRVAISNGRLLDIGDGRVTFSYKDRKDGDKVKELTIPAQEFIHRFLQHVLPRGLWRMRHYGILCNRYKKVRLARCREVLGMPPPVVTPKPRKNVELLLFLTGFDSTKCPSCKEGKMVVVAKLLPPPRRGQGPIVVPLLSAAPLWEDTS